MEKHINNNGYDYIDLCLPSGALWATMNVGASKPSDCGLYFQWGDTQGYTVEQVGKEKLFNWGDYKFNPSGDGKTFTKYKTTGTTLDLEDDAAHANMGGDWHMPTPHQIEELINFATSSWTKINGVNGRLFTSMKDKSNSIFIPAAGFAWDGSVQSSGSYGVILSSMLGMENANDVYGLFFHSEEAYLFNNLERYFGHSLRGVIG